MNYAIFNRLRLPGRHVLAGSVFYKWVASSDDYYLAGRRLTPFILAAVLTATNVNLYSFIGQTGIAYREGISIIWQTWTGNMAMVISGLFILPVFRRLRIKTIPEFLEMRYSRECEPSLPSYGFSG